MVKPVWPTCPLCREPMREKRRGAYHRVCTFGAVLQLASATPEHLVWAIAQHDRAQHFHSPAQRQAVIETAQRVAAALPHLSRLPRNLGKVHPDYGESRGGKSTVPPSQPPTEKAGEP